GSSSGLAQFQHLKEFSCKDCAYCRDRLNDFGCPGGNCYGHNVSQVKQNGEDAQGPTSVLPHSNLPPCCLDNKAVRNECCQCELHNLRNHCQNQNITTPNYPDASSPTLSQNAQNCALSSSSLSSQSSSHRSHAQAQSLPWQSESLLAAQTGALISSNRPGDFIDNTAAEDAPGNQVRCISASHTFPTSVARHISQPPSPLTASSSLPSTDHRQHSLTQENISTITGSKNSSLSHCPSGNSDVCTHTNDLQPSSKNMSQSVPSTPFSTAHKLSVAAQNEDAQDFSADKVKRRVTKDASRPSFLRSSSTEGCAGVGSVSSDRQIKPYALDYNTFSASKSAAFSLPPSPLSQSQSSSSSCSSQSERNHLHRNPRLGMTASSSLPVLFPQASPSHSPAPSSPATPPAPATVECKWRGCKAPNDLDPSDLLEHIRQHAEEQIANKAYACLWADCKVYNKPSWSGSWLERHIVSHSGHRPFKCILDNCGQRFHSQAALERHVNSHFGANGGSGSGHAGGGASGMGNGGGPGGSNGGRVGGRSREEMSHHRMTLKRKRQLKRRCMQTVRRHDFFDEQSMAVLRQDLQALTKRSGLDVIPGARPLDVAFARQVVGRRTSQSGAQQMLVEHTPSNILEDTWISSELLQTSQQEDSGENTSKKKRKASAKASSDEGWCCPESFPLYRLPAETVSNLHASLYRRHRFRKHKRK
ncbi:hypothetical protein EGW08_003574, partial [Elysia chlorotica]